MPNWVFNNIGNYPKELHEKYKGEDTDIDFNKIIPMPEELQHTIAGSISESAKEIVDYRDYYAKLKEECSTLEHKEEVLQHQLKYDFNNPLKNTVRNIAENTARSIGYLSIENPDKTLNTLLEDDNNKYQKGQYDQYTSIFGNNSYDHCTNFEHVYDNYINAENKHFEESKNSKWNEGALDKYSDIEDYGRTLKQLKQKYGSDNWYDWSNKNWNTKWNSSNTEYDPETQQIKFDTPWSIPYPIIAKIAEDNPEVKLDGYSEEETGWFDEYKTEDGKLEITAHGELHWDDDGNETTETRQECSEVYTYDQMRQESINTHEAIVNAAKKLSERL